MVPEVLGDRLALRPHHGAVVVVVVIMVMWMMVWVVMWVAVAGLGGVRVGGSGEGGGGEELLWSGSSGAVAR